MLELKTKIIFDPKDLTKKHVSQGSWLKVSICQTECDIHEYYAWFLNTRFNLKLNKPIRKAHITIIKDKIPDIELYKQAKQMFDGKEVVFKYDPNEIRTNGKHWWLKVYSDDVKNIRTILGLTPEPKHPFHLTIGYANEKYIDHSKYILETITRYDL